MKIDKKTVRNLFLIVLCAITFYWVLNETEQFKSLWSAAIGLVSPFIVGAAIAFILNVPLRTMERLLGFIKNPGLRRTFSIILTLVVVALVIAGVVMLLIPQITETIQILIPKLMDFFTQMETKIAGFLDENPALLQWFSETTDLKVLTGVV